MSETERVKPALTSEEWARREARSFTDGDGAYLANEGATCLMEWFRWNADGEEESMGDLVVVHGESAFRYPIADRHGTAALCLHGQPFGFTREDVRAIWFILDEADLCDKGPRGEGWCSDRMNASESRLRSLADRIEALLPPEEP